jgi:hypothetical protein
VAATATEFDDTSRWSAACIGPDPEPYRRILADFVWEPR